MRAALNSNRVVQIAVLGLGAILVAVLLLSRLGGGEAESPSQSAPAGGASEGEAATATPGPGAGATTATEGAGPTDATARSGGATADPAAPPTAPTAAGSLVPGKGLPQNVIVAYARDRAVVLLVVKKRGIDDRLVERSVQRLRSRSDVAVFVIPVKDIARYSRITQGVSVSRTPALIVVLPRSRTNSIPTATVSYGFRGAASVEQAVENALYSGATVPYHPG